MPRERLYLFDTTLRDGAQTNGVDFTLADKLVIARMLDDLGIDYVEAGYPGANPTDTNFFAEKRPLRATLTPLVDFRVVNAKDTTRLTVGAVKGTMGTKGKGFAGVVKRHHFAGGPKTHGQSDRHRSAGSVGAGPTPGRVFKGMRMAGHLGNRRTTIQNLEVVEVDTDRNVLLVKGAVPGARNGVVMVRKAVKAQR